ncbi:MAG TPA: MFS transporter [Allosphingosinicella sp.]|nr:MFS transporter [Allosphingosinicella sp.]
MSKVASNASSTDAAKLGGRAAWIALILVSLTQAMSMVDRQILAILVPHIERDLGIARAEIGLLYGTVFALFYAIFSLPLGRLADGWVRTRLLSISIIAWSGATALAGTANSFAMLALSRLGVGIGEASVQPAGLSLLADSFPREKRGMITAWIAAATALGLGGAIVMGGLSAEWWNNAWPAGEAPLGLRGWQFAFLTAAIPGLILGWFLARMPEPTRGAADGVASKADPRPFGAAWDTLLAILPILCWINFSRRRASAALWLANLAGLASIVAAAVALTLWTESLRPHVPPLHLFGLTVSGSALQWSIAGLGAYVLLNWLQATSLTDRPAFAVIARAPAVWLVIGVASLQSVVNYGVMGWTPTFIVQHFQQSQASTALHFGLLSAVIGVAGALIAGPISDWACKRWAGGRVWVTLFSLGVSPFLGFITYRAPDVTSFYLWFVLYSIVLCAWLPPVYATLLDLVLPRMRGVVMSFYILAQTIVGLGVGPYMVGLISDLNGGDLGSAILSVYWFGPPIVIFLIILIRQLPRDEARLIQRARDAGEPV